MSLFTDVKLSRIETKIDRIEGKLDQILAEQQRRARLEELAQQGIVTVENLMVSPRK